MKPQTALLQFGVPFCPAGHCLPQPPQLFTSLCRFVHAPLQLTSGEMQLSVQAPPLHTCPEGQTFPQVPQFCESEATSTQTLLQLCWPLGHDGMQVPPMHAALPPWGAAQLVLQLPQ